MHSCATESLTVTQARNGADIDSPTLSNFELPASSELNLSIISDKSRRHGTHYYPDGNIIIVVEDVIFKLHKSMLAAHSKIFGGMFEVLSCGGPVNPASEDIQTVPLHDELSTFVGLLDALYRGLYFTSRMNVRHCLNVLEISSKYEVGLVESYCQQFLVDELPTSALDPFDNWDRFQRYYKDRSLASISMRICPKYLAPWDFYILTIQTISELNTLPSELMTTTPPLLDDMDKTFVYQMLVLQHVNHKAVAEWNHLIDTFYTTKCAKASSSRDKCARAHTTFDRRSPLFIPLTEDMYDPLKLIIPRVKKHVLWKGSTHDTSRNYWCYHCSNLLNGIAKEIVTSIYTSAVGSTIQLGYIPGGTPKCSLTSSPIDSPVPWTRKDFENSP